MLDSGRADHIQGVRDRFGRLAAVTGEILHLPSRHASRIDASGWPSAVENKDAALEHIWFWLPGQAQSQEKPMPGSVGQVCTGVVEGNGIFYSRLRTRGHQQGQSENQSTLVI